MKEYWDSRFSGEGMIWGTVPSSTADYARERFNKHGAKRILIPGAGYGRNSKLFSSTGFIVDGIEISQEAITLAKSWDKATHFFCGSVLDMPFSKEVYDAVYCYDIIHLFLKNDRRLLIKKCIDQLKEGGLMFFTCFSELDSEYGKGKRIEENTFESKPGKIVHFFTQEDLFEHFEGLEIIEDGIIKERFDYSRGGSKEYSLRYILACKNIL